MSDFTDIKILGAKIGVQVLRLQDTREAFLKWARDIEVIARAKGLGYILRNTEVLVEEPQITDYIFFANDTMTGVEMYRKELEEYRDLVRRSRLARCLLDFWVDDAVRGAVHDVDDPYDAWDALHETFGVTLKRSSKKEDAEQMQA